MRLAMTRMPGEPLDLFLEAWRHRRSAPSERRVRVSHSCTLARELLLQLSPTFECISSHAFHRDVNAHNILIDAGWDVAPSFGLVDFGLAVDAHCWQMEDNGGVAPTQPTRVGADGACTWHHLDVGGDCRYWPVSAWLQFLLGWREVSSSPAMLLEYQSRLDLHALGITATQVLAETLPQMSAEPDGAAGPSLADVPDELWALQRAWERYWGHVLPMHCQLVDTFTNAGDWDALKMEYISNSVHQTVAEDLRALRVAIRDAGDACSRAPVSADVAGFPGLCAALLALLDADGAAEQAAGTGPANGPRCWREIHRLLRQGAATYQSATSGSKKDKPVAAGTLKGESNSDLLKKISQLSDKVDQLAQAMARLEERRDGRAN